MAYTKDGIMAQIYVAFGQGAGAIRVTQEAAMELHRWYYNAITPQIVDVEWAIWALQILDRIRAIGSLAAVKATTSGSVSITPGHVYDSAVQVQETSETDFCPPPPPPI